MAHLKQRCAPNVMQFCWSIIRPHVHAFKVEPTLSYLARSCCPLRLTIPQELKSPATARGRARCQRTGTGRLQQRAVREVVEKGGRNHCKTTRAHVSVNFRRWDRLERRIAMAGRLRSGQMVLWWKSRKGNEGEAILSRGGFAALYRSGSMRSFLDTEVDRERGEGAGRSSESKTGS